jgi:hypothetical protein
LDKREANGAFPGSNDLDECTPKEDFPDCGRLPERAAEERGA